MASNVRQHFVPQFYLLGFKADGGGLFAFDKLSKKSFPTTVKDAANERYFYDIPAGVETSKGFDRRGVEKTLAKLEGGFQPILRDFIAAADDGSISTRLLAKLAPFVAIQFMRTKTYRMVTEALINQSMQSLTDRLLEVNFPGQKATVEIKPDYLPMVQAQQFLDPEKIYRFGRELTSLSWAVGINDTEHPLYTSDHPVARRNKGGNIGDPVGMAIPGLEIAFPLTKRHLLIIYDAETFPERRIREMRSFTMPEADVTDYNGLRDRRQRSLRREIHLSSDGTNNCRQTPFQHDAYLTELTRLRDQLKAGLSATTHQSDSEEGSSASDLAAKIKALKSAHSIDATPQRVGQKQSTAEEPVTARIRRRTVAMPLALAPISPDAVSLAGVPADHNAIPQNLPHITFRERIASERQDVEREPE